MNKRSCELLVQEKIISVNALLDESGFTSSCRTKEQERKKTSEGTKRTESN